MPSPMLCLFSSFPDALSIGKNSRNFLLVNFKPNLNHFHASSLNNNVNVHSSHPKTVNLHFHFTEAFEFSKKKIINETYSPRLSLHSVLGSILEYLFIKRIFFFLTFSLKLNQEKRNVLNIILPFYIFIFSMEYQSFKYFKKLNFVLSSTLPFSPSSMPFETSALKNSFHLSHSFKFIKPSFTQSNLLNFDKNMPRHLFHVSAFYRLNPSMSYKLKNLKSSLHSHDNAHTNHEISESNSNSNSNSNIQKSTDSNEKATNECQHVVDQNQNQMQSLIRAALIAKLWMNSSSSSSSSSSSPSPAIQRNDMEHNLIDQKNLNHPSNDLHQQNFEKKVIGQTTSKESQNMSNEIESVSKESQNILYESQSMDSSDTYFKSEIKSNSNLNSSSNSNPLFRRDKRKIKDYDNDDDDDDDDYNDDEDEDDDENDDGRDDDDDDDVKQKVWTRKDRMNDGYENINNLNNLNNIINKNDREGYYRRRKVINMDDEKDGVDNRFRRDENDRYRRNEYIDDDDDDDDDDGMKEEKENEKRRKQMMNRIKSKQREGMKKENNDKNNNNYNDSKEEYNSYMIDENGYYSDTVEILPPEKNVWENVFSNKTKRDTFVDMAQEIDLPFETMEGRKGREREKEKESRESQKEYMSGKKEKERRKFYDAYQEEEEEEDGGVSRRNERRRVNMRSGDEEIEERRGGRMGKGEEVSNLPFQSSQREMDAAIEEKERRKERKKKKEVKEMDAAIEEKERRKERKKKKEVKEMKEEDEEEEDDEMKETEEKEITMVNKVKFANAKDIFDDLIKEGNQKLKKGREGLEGKIDVETSSQFLTQSVQSFSNALELFPESLAVIGQRGNAMLAHAELKLKFSRQLRSQLDELADVDRQERERRRKKEMAKRQMEGFEEDDLVEEKEREKERRRRIKMMMNLILSACEEGEELLMEAGRCYRKALSMDKNDYRALYNWGLALCYRGQLISDEKEENYVENADRMFLAAIDKFEAMLSLSDNWRAGGRLALLNWGLAVRDRSRLRPIGSRERVKLLEQSRRLLDQANQLDPGNEQVRAAVLACNAELEKLAEVAKRLEERRRQDQFPPKKWWFG